MRDPERLIEGLFEDVTFLKSSSDPIARCVQPSFRQYQDIFLCQALVLDPWEETAKFFATLSTRIERCQLTDCTSRAFHDHFYDLLLLPFFSKLYGQSCLKFLMRAVDIYKGIIRPCLISMRLTQISSIWDFRMMKVERAMRPQFLEPLSGWTPFPASPDPVMDMFYNSLNEDQQGPRRYYVPYRTNASESVSSEEDSVFRFVANGLAQQIQRETEGHKARTELYAPAWEGLAAMNPYDPFNLTLRCFQPEDWKKVMGIGRWQSVSNPRQLQRWLRDHGPEKPLSQGTPLLSGDQLMQQTASLPQVYPGLSVGIIYCRQPPRRAWTAQRGGRNKRIMISAADGLDDPFLGANDYVSERPALAQLNAAGINAQRYPPPKPVAHGQSFDGAYHQVSGALSWDNSRYPAQQGMSLYGTRPQVQPQGMPSYGMQPQGMRPQGVDPQSIFLPTMDSPSFPQYTNRPPPPFPGSFQSRPPRPSPIGNLGYPMNWDNVQTALEPGDPSEWWRSNLEEWNNVPGPS